MDSIPNFAPADIETVQQLVYQRYGRGIEIQLTNPELMLNPTGEQQIDYPTVFWHVHRANFAVIRSGLNRFRCKFFYTPHDQHGTGRKEYDSLEQCVTTLLQIQANHERNHDQS